ncbi:hypothetical protein, partial [Thiolapillus sp.]|uniref:hypothetical protein n=1 Tax=Thiolapillus sp. TaxID=2017437 RepID=UPI003AF634D6
FLTVVPVCFVVLHAEERFCRLIPTGCYICLLCSGHVHSRMHFLKTLMGFDVAENRYRQAVVFLCHVLCTQQNGFSEDALSDVDTAGM